MTIKKGTNVLKHDPNGSFSPTPDSTPASSHSPTGPSTATPSSLITTHHGSTSCQIKTFKLRQCLFATFPFSQQHIAEIIEDISRQTVSGRWKAEREPALTAPHACGGNKGLSKVSPGVYLGSSGGDLKALPSLLHSLWRVLYPQWFTEAQDQRRVMNERSSWGVRARQRWHPTASKDTNPTLVQLLFLTGPFPQASQIKCIHAFSSKMQNRHSHIKKVSMAYLHQQD